MRTVLTTRLALMATYIKDTGKSYSVSLHTRHAVYIYALYTLRHTIYMRTGNYTIDKTPTT